MCKLIGGADHNGHTPMEILGTGTLQDPFEVIFTGVDVDDTATVNMSIVFDEARGYVISATATNGGTLASLSDVSVPAPTNGQVLAYNTSTHKWEAHAPTTAPGGALSTDNSLDGDGSVGNILEVAHASGRMTATFPTGIGLTDTAIQQLVRSFSDATARAAADPSPELNALSVLDSAPGVIQYWDGTTWQTLNTSTGIAGLGYKFITSAVPFQISGGYTGGPVTMLIKSFNTQTIIDGTFTMFSAADLSPYAGVLGAWANMDYRNPGSGTDTAPGIYYSPASPGPLRIAGISYGNATTSVPLYVSGTAYALVYT